MTTESHDQEEEREEDNDGKGKIYFERPRPQTERCVSNGGGGEEISLIGVDRQRGALLPADH